MRADARDDRARSLSVGREAVLRLRPRQQPVVSARPRRRGGDRREAARARGHLRGHRATRADDLLRRARRSSAAMLQVEGAASAFDLSSLRFCVSAGEALPPEIFRRWRERFGLRDRRRHRLDRAAPHLHLESTRRVSPRDLGSSAGLRRASSTTRALDAARRAVIGTLLVRGESAAAGYWKQAREDEGDLQGPLGAHRGQVHPGRGRVLRVLRRCDDMLKVGGIWVSPVEVENTILTHEAVVECAVVGAADADGLIKPRAFVVLRPGATTVRADRTRHPGVREARIAPTSIRAGSSSSPSCRRPRPASCSGSGSADARGPGTGVSPSRWVTHTWQFLPRRPHL